LNMKTKLHDKCISCGRQLTIYEHKERGFGPECWNKVEKLELPIEFIERQIDGEKKMLWAEDCNLDDIVAQVANRAEAFDEKFVVFSAWDLPYSRWSFCSKSILLGHRKKLGIEIDEKMPNHIRIDPLRLKRNKYVPLAYIFSEAESFEIICHTDWKMKVSLLDASTAWYEPIFTNQSRKKFEEADLSYLKKLIPKAHTTMFTKLVSKHVLNYDYFYEDEEIPLSIQEIGDTEYVEIMDEMLPQVEQLLLTGNSVNGRLAWGLDIDEVQNWIWSRPLDTDSFWIEKILESLQRGETSEHCSNVLGEQIWKYETEKIALRFTENRLDSWNWIEHAKEIWECMYDPEYDISGVSKMCFEKLFQAIRKY